ncbi:hypothetical protein [Bradyrhizobium neotropicale]|uniref:hypothetical protein n=1 Tax=Bradyrhizobium neotropicale TaxID=1497615 RepID=UPI001AD7236B|nr:hypothetical protein [Bradyrhizobium neotropicale]
MFSNSLSMGRPRLPKCAGSLHHEVRATKPFAVVWRRVGARFKIEAGRDLSRNLARQRVAAGAIEREEVVYGIDFHKAGFFGREWRNLALEESSDVVGAGRDASDVLESEVSPQNQWVALHRQDFWNTKNQ